MNIKIESGANVQITDKPIVNVYGDVVQHQEVHIHPEFKGKNDVEVEDVVEVGEKKNNPSRKKKPSGEKTPKSRVAMTFKRKSNVLDGHLTLLFDKLTKAGWIEGNEPDFKALFSGKLDDDCQLIWKSVFGKGTLVELFKQMIVAKLINVPEGFTLPAILEGHFKDTLGNWLTGLDKGNGANAKALPFISECVKLLKITPNDGYQDDEDFQSVYDPYDYQDMKLHKR